MNEIDKMFDKATETVSFQDLITEAADEVSKISFSCDGTCANAQVLANSVMRDYNLNCKQSALKCYKEGGTPDDLAFYEERASEGAVGKLKAIIDKVIMIWRDTIYKIKMAVATRVQSASGKAALKDAKKQVAMHPEIANVKVTAPDITTALSVISKFRGLCNVESEQYVHSLTGPTKVKSLGGLMEDFQKSFDRAIIGKAAICVVTIAGLIMAIEAEMNKLPSLIEELDLKETTILKRLSASVSYETEVGAVAALQQAAQFRVQLGKQELNTHMKYLADMVSRLTSSISEALTGKAPIINNVVEDADGVPMLSVDEYFGEDAEDSSDDDKYDAVFDESVNYDARAILKSTDEQFRNEMKIIKDARKKADYSTAVDHCKKAMSAIDDAKKKIKSLPASSGSTIIGLLDSFAKNWVKIYAVTWVSNNIGESKKNQALYRMSKNPSLANRSDYLIGQAISTVPAVVTACAAAIKGASNAVHAIKDNDGITVAQFNTYTNKIIVVLDNMKKNLQKQMDACNKAASLIKESAEESDTDFPGMITTEDADKVFSEAMDYLDSVDVENDEVFSEGANLDARRLFRDSKKEYAKLLGLAKSEFKNGNYQAAKSYCDRASVLLMSVERQLRNLSSDMDVVKWGTIADDLITFGQTTLVLVAEVASCASGAFAANKILDLGINDCIKAGTTAAGGKGFLLLAYPLVALVQKLDQYDTIKRSAKRNGGKPSPNEINPYINGFRAMIMHSQKNIDAIAAECDKRRNALIGLKY